MFQSIEHALLAVDVSIHLIHITKWVYQPHEENGAFFPVN